MTYHKLNYQIYFENAIENNQLKLIAGERRWRKFILNITELVWARNFFDGYLIHVYDLDYSHICTLKVGWECANISYPDKIKITVDYNAFERV